MDIPPPLREKVRYFAVGSTQALSQGADIALRRAELSATFFEGLAPSLLSRAVGMGKHEHVL